MDCIYYNNFDKSSSDIILRGDEISHIKALRIKIGQSLLVSNGLGLIVKVKLISISKKENHLKIEEYYEEYNENIHKKILITGILDNKDRYEFLLEKAIELGISDFVPLHSRYVQKNNVNLARLEKKAISAMKQCKRARLTKIHNTINLKEIISYTDEIDNIIILDMKQSETKSITGSSLYIVGPEGGFDENELEFIYKIKNLQKWNLGQRRLRTETAAISALSIGEFLND